MAQANERFRVKLHPTALASDVLFYHVVDGRLGKNDTPEYGTAYHKALPTAPEGFNDHKLVHITPAPRSSPGEELWYFAADRDNQDLYNFQHSQADIGGTRFDSIERSYIHPRADYSPTTPAQGSSMPNVPVNLFGDGTGTPSVIDDYVLSERKQGSSGVPELDSLYISEVRVYVKRCTHRTLGVDALNGAMLHADDDLYYRGEVLFTVDDVDFTPELLFSLPTYSWWGIQADGSQRIGKQLSCNWWLVTTEQVVGGEFTDGAVVVDTFSTNDNANWPPVLEQFELLDWERLDGGIDIYPAIRFNPEGYSGPCATTITRTWSVDPFTIPAIVPMKPTRIYYASPYYTLNISECLHGLIGVRCDIGSADPVYDENTGSTRYFSATEPTVWPNTQIIADDQEPFRGGYLRTQRVATKPSIPATVGWTTGV